MKFSLIFVLIFAVAAEKSNLWLIDEIIPPINLEAYSLVRSKSSELEQMKSVGCSCRNVDGCVVNNVKIYSRDFELKCDEIFELRVKSFRFVNSEVNFLPNNLKKFKNLEIIQVENSSFLEITQNDLKEFKNLKSLQLSENKIKILDENLFKFNPNVEKLNFARNQINFIHPQLFDGLSLAELQLDDNDCMSCSGFERNFLKFVIEVATENCAIKVEKSNCLSKIFIMMVISIILLISGLTIYILLRKRMNRGREILENPTDNKFISPDWKEIDEFNGGKFNHGANLNDTLRKIDISNALKKNFNSPVYSNTIARTLRPAPKIPIQSDVIYENTKVLGTRKN